MSARNDGPNRTIGHNTMDTASVLQRWQRISGWANEWMVPGVFDTLPILCVCTFCSGRSPFRRFGAAHRRPNPVNMAACDGISVIHQTTRAHTQAHQWFFFSIFSWVSIRSVRSSSFFSHSFDLFGVCITQIPRSACVERWASASTLYLFTMLFVICFCLFPFLALPAWANCTNANKAKWLWLWLVQTHTHSHRIDMMWMRFGFFRFGLRLWVDVCVYTTLMYVQCALWLPLWHSHLRWCHLSDGGRNIICTEYKMTHILTQNERYATYTSKTGDEWKWHTKTSSSGSNAPGKMWAKEMVYYFCGGRALARVWCEKCVWHDVWIIVYARTMRDRDRDMCERRGAVEHV